MRQVSLLSFMTIYVAILEPQNLQIHEFLCRSELAIDGFSGSMHNFETYRHFFYLSTVWNTWFRVKSEIKRSLAWPRKKLSCFLIGGAFLSWETELIYFMPSWELYLVTLCYISLLLYVYLFASYFSLPSSPTSSFTIWEPQNSRIDEFYTVQEHRATDCKAPQLWKGSLGLGFFNLAVMAWHGEAVGSLRSHVGHPRRRSSNRCQCRKFS